MSEEKTPAEKALEVLYTIAEGDGDDNNINAALGAIVDIRDMMAQRLAMDIVIRVAKTGVLHPLEKKWMFEHGYEDFV